MLTDIIIVLAIMILGMGIGLFIGNRPKVIKIVGVLTSFSIFLLLFLLGIGVGTNDRIINNLDTIGIQALVLTIGALLGSLICAYFTYSLFFKKK
ncbi:LysO family transporter [Labilibaculum sp. DW002]|uniref:LysO family transporter n=1 Tax=Paralabilibaculum antarcticum TaxID=2912572 RepID=A0ABT5VSH1_9BACT|nr:LysO family transporter [Labilibaculum sp. DW002]MDE5417732.1 LysO family transporter [Labilibaculum sp. DW002]